MDIFDSPYFYVNKRLTTCIGLWPYDTGKKYFIRTFWLLTPAFLAVPQIIGMRINSSCPEKVMEHIAMVLFISVVFLKLFALILAENKLKFTYSGIVSNWLMIVDKNEKAILLKYSERGRKMTILYLAFMLLSYLVVVLPPMVPLILDKVSPLPNLRSRMYIFHGEFLFDKKDHYFTIYVCDNFLMFTLVILNVSIDTMYAICVEHCDGIFSIVKYRLQSIDCLVQDNMDFSSKEDEFYNYVIEIVKLHQKILNFAKILESSYSTCFLLLTCITIALGPLACVLIISSLDNPVALLRYTMGLGCIGNHLFYLCYPGQRLMDISGGIFIDIYCNEWYKCSVRTKKLLRFLMLRSMKPSLLTAGGFMVMNMENYLIITKTAMSYITVLASAR